MAAIFVCNVYNSPSDVWNSKSFSVSVDPCSFRHRNLAVYVIFSCNPVTIYSCGWMSLRPIKAGTVALPRGTKSQKPLSVWLSWLKTRWHSIGFGLDENRHRRVYWSLYDPWESDVICKLCGNAESKMGQ